MPANHLESVTFSSQFVSITIAVHVSLLLPDERTEAEQMFLRWVRTQIRESEINDGEYTPTLPSILPENISMLASHTRRELLRIKQNQG